MIGTIDVRCIAAHPNLPLSPLYTFKNSASSIRLMDVPKKVGNWVIENVSIQVTYPDESIVSKECVKTGALWIGTIEGTATTGKTSNGFSIVASGKDEDGNQVSDYVLGVGDVIVMDYDGSVEPGHTVWTIHFYDEMPTEPRKGDAYYNGTTLMIYDGQKWSSTFDGIKFGNNDMYEAGIPKNVVFGNKDEADGSYIDVTAGSMYFATRYASMETDSTSISPSNIAIFTPDNVGMINVNDITIFSQMQGESWIDVAGSKVVTESDIEDYAKKEELPTKTSDLTNDSDFITSSYIGKGIVTVKQGTVQCGTFGLNDSSNKTVIIPPPKDNKIAIKQGGVEKGSFTLNQGTDATIELDAGMTSSEVQTMIDASIGSVLTTEDF